MLNGFLLLNPNKAEKTKQSLLASLFKVEIFSSVFHFAVAFFFFERIYFNHIQFKNKNMKI